MCFSLLPLFLHSPHVTLLKIGFLPTLSFSLPLLLLHIEQMPPIMEVSDAFYQALFSTSKCTQDSER